MRVRWRARALLVLLTDKREVDGRAAVEGLACIVPALILGAPNRKSDPQRANHRSVFTASQSLLGRV